jgi:hypothetical protein
VQFFRSSPESNFESEITIKTRIRDRAIPGARGFFKVQSGGSRIRSSLRSSDENAKAWQNKLSDQPLTRVSITSTLE